MDWTHVTTDTQNALSMSVGPPAIQLKQTPPQTREEFLEAILQELRLHTILLQKIHNRLTRPSFWKRLWRKLCRGTT